MGGGWRVVIVDRLLNVLAPCSCIAEPPRHVYVLPHGDRSCRYTSNLLAQSLYTDTGPTSRSADPKIPQPCLHPDLSDDLEGETSASSAGDPGLASRPSQTSDVTHFRREPETSRSLQRTLLCVVGPRERHSKTARDHLGPYAPQR